MRHGGWPTLSFCEGGSCKVESDTEQRSAFSDFDLASVLSCNRKPVENCCSAGTSGITLRSNGLSIYTQVVRFLPRRLGILCLGGNTNGWSFTEVVQNMPAGRFIDRG